MQSKFSKHLTGFCKNHSTQNALLVMIEKWKTILNKKLKVGALFMDLSKAFDTLEHSLLLAKLSVHGFDPSYGFGSQFIKLCSKLFKKQISKM